MTNQIHEIPGYLKNLKMCNEAVRIESYSLGFVPDHLKESGNDQNVNIMIT